MPQFDTPITTDDTSFPKILAQNLPVLLYLYNRADTALTNALNTVAKEQAGKLLVARVDASQSPKTFADYQTPVLPALVALKNGEILAHSSPASPDDVKTNAGYLLGDAKPQSKPAQPKTEAKSNGNGVKAKPAAVSDSSFAKDVLQSDVPVLVDFWATWCPPCRMVAPILDKMAEKFDGKVKILKLDVDQNPGSASRYQTHSIPTMILFKNGREVNRLVGAQPQPNIERFIQSALPQKTTT